MTTQTKVQIAAIYALLDETSPGWRSAYSNFEKAVEAAGARAEKAAEKAAQKALLKATAEYRATLKQMVNAIPTLPTPRILEDECDSVRDRDVSVFDASGCGRVHNMERRDGIGSEVPSYDQSYDDDDVSTSAGVSPGRIEDHLFHDYTKPPEKGDSLQCRVRRAIKYKFTAYVWVHRPPREGVVYGNRCW